MSPRAFWRRVEGRATRAEEGGRSLRSTLTCLPWLSIALLAFLASATGLANGFVYDDRPIVQRNPRVHTLAEWWEVFGQAYWPPDWGDTNYRPLTILSFAVQWAFGDGSPLVFHAVSVALYLAACVAVLSLARLVLPAYAAWIVAALFAVHPVHVEAVGNIVGQAELAVALCSTLAVAAYVKTRTDAEGRGMTGRPLLLIAVLYAVASFSKETGFLLPGLLVAAELTVVATRLDPARRTLRARARDLWQLYAICAVIALGYLALRRSVLGGFGDDPNMVISLLGHEARILTMVGVVPEWARLLLWPARLAADYSPPQISVILGPSAAVIPGIVILLGAALLAIAGWRTQGRVATFGLLWLAVTIFPVSNLILRSGVIVAERTLFLPSLGALLALGAGVVWVMERATEELPASRRWALAVPVVLLLALGVAKSATRQRIWRSSDDFLSRIVEDAPLSYRAHYMHGMWLFEKGRPADGERHVRRAIAMFPYDAGPYTDLADQYRRAGLCAPARELYQRAMSLGPMRDRARIGFIVCLLRDAHFVEAAEQARIGVAGGGQRLGDFRHLLAVADSAVNATTGAHQSGAARRSPSQEKGPRP